MYTSFKPSAPVVTMHDPQSDSPNWVYYRTDVTSSPSQTVSGPPRLEPTSVSPADIRGATPHIESSQLMSRPSSRVSRSPLSPAPSYINQLPVPTLFPHNYTQHISGREHVPPFVVNASSDRPGPSTVNNGLPRPSPLGSDSLSSFAPSQYGSITAPSHRLRTPAPVFHSTSDLAAHHGLPRNLPPVPRTTRYLSTATSSHSDPVPSSSSSNELPFSTLCTNYLTMLSQNAQERDAAVNAAATDSADNGAAVQALMEVLQASPEFRMVDQFDEFLTSPMDDSPWEEFLTTPALGSAGEGSHLLTSPAIVDVDDFGNFGDGPLFGAGSLGLTDAASEPKAPAHLHPPPVTTLLTPAMNYDALDGMYTMSSPNTPALDPASLHPSPRVQSVAPPTPAQSRRRNVPTGTRKNITPESLMPLEAPIQDRKYVTPSATSRKDVPAHYIKKRSRSQAFGDADDIDAASLPQTDLEAIEAKRRQNTLAARRSRKRKLEYQRELELSIEQEKAEKEMWKSRAMMFEGMLRGHGLEVPSFDT